MGRRIDIDIFKKNLDIPNISVHDRPPLCNSTTSVANQNVRPSTSRNSMGGYSTDKIIKT